MLSDEHNGLEIIFLLGILALLITGFLVCKSQYDRNIYNKNIETVILSSKTMPDLKSQLTDKEANYKISLANKDGSEYTLCIYDKEGDSKDLSKIYHINTNEKEDIINIDNLNDKSSIF